MCKAVSAEAFGQKMIIIYRERIDNTIRFIEVVFYERNYQHLTGLELIDKDGILLRNQASNFYGKCIENKLGLEDFQLVDKVMGDVNFCLGLSKEDDVYVPSSVTLHFWFLVVIWLL